jgi:GTPase SAR1 family protein
MFVAPFLKSIPINMHSSDEILDFCESLSGGYEERSIVKLVVLGKGGIGKSTLVNFFKHCNKALATVFILLLIQFSFLTLYLKQVFNKYTGSNPSNFMTQSTIGIDNCSLEMSNGTISVWDFAGQLEYTVTHQYFLSSEVSIHSFSPFTLVLFILS